MKRIKKLFGSFRIKVAAALIISLFFVASLSNFIIYKFSLDSQFKQLREKLMIIAQTATLSIDADLLLQVPLERSGIDSPAYKTIDEKLLKIKKVNPPLRYIYAMVKTEKEGVWKFVIDSEEITPAIRKRIAAYPGDEYDASRFPEMLKAFEGASADTKLEIDEWGVTLSGYAPIWDREGKAIAMLGVDLMADDVYKIQREVHRRGLFVLGVGIIFSLLLGMLVSNRITYPIRKLVLGTRRIAEGDLQSRVEIKGHDEIGELAHSFNEMAEKLSESRKKLHDYFYRAMHSLVSVLEAKDPYTRGHSERVAAYAEKIALKMEFPPAKIELLVRAAQLHDIGKLAIQKDTLNKEGKLNEEEFKIIKEHPVLGEDILRPVVLDREMLEMIRSHHERYDGKGYPDKIKEGEINIFAQIIAVADAYDAMTSERPYRRSFSKDKAMLELKNNAGTQFNPEIVEAFLRVLISEHKV